MERPSTARARPLASSPQTASAFGMRLPRLRRSARQRSADDDDWGTSSPAAIMDENIPPSVRPHDRTLAGAIATLKQQDLTSYTCTFSPRCVISIYFVIALIFIPIGAALVAGTASIRSTGKQVYSTLEECDPETNQTNGPMTRSCIVEVPIENTIRAPSYLYYSLTDFYQNARKYAKSRSDVMNMGSVPSAPIDVSTCEPWLFRPNTSEGANGFDVNEFRYPCGLTAFSTFNDTFEFCKDKICDQQFNLKKEGIAWQTDVKYKFRPNEESELFSERVERASSPDNTSANDLLQDEDFIVWMRLSAFRDFDKLYRIIEEDIPGDKVYYMRINSSFPVQSFNGTKAFEITTVKWFGGSNPFLGASYLIIGLGALGVACFLLASHVLAPQSSRPPDPAIWMREHLEKFDLE